MAIYVWIAIGSAFGGVSRYWLSGVLARAFGETFPWGTLLVNVSGSLVVGMVAALTIPDGRLFIGSTTRLAVMAGFLGGYTTFSSFSLQTLALMQDGEWAYAGANIALSVIACLAAVWVGYALGNAFNAMKWI